MTIPNRKLLIPAVTGCAVLLIAGGAYYGMHHRDTGPKAAVGSASSIAKNQKKYANKLVEIHGVLIKTSTGFAIVDTEGKTRTGVLLDLSKSNVDVSKFFNQNDQQSKSIVIVRGTYEVLKTDKTKPSVVSLVVDSITD